MYVCTQHKKDSILQVKNKPRIGIRYMLLFLAHQSIHWLRTSRTAELWLPNLKDFYADLNDVHGVL
jgi:hypothetical protein